MKTQNTASRSRRNSRIRIVVSSTRGCSVCGLSLPRQPFSWTRVSFASAIAEHSPCQTDEYVFECRLVCSECDEFCLLSFDLGKQCRQSHSDLGNGECINVAAFVQVIDCRKSLQRIFCKLLRDTEFYDLIGAERFNQLGRRSECDHLPVVHDRNAVAKTCGFFHVV